MRSGTRPSPVQIVLLSVPALLLVPRLAGGYSCEGLVRRGCHEQITSEALRRVRTDPEAAVPVRGTSNERALIDDVQFDLEDDMTDLGAVTLLTGVRDNDLKGLSVDDLASMAQVHGDPDTQDEHCLRGADQVEPGGSETGLRECRAFIRERVLQALNGLDATGQPDMTLRTDLTLRLSLRGTMDASLPAYYVRMGQALHALQDSFTHAYRTPDGLGVTVLLNWLDVTKGRLVESRDGPAHASELDQCVDLDAFRSDRLELATVASTELLAATLGSGLSPQEKIGKVDAVLDRYLGYSAGCTFDNDWCNAAERGYGNGSGCAVAGAGGAHRPGVLVALIALVGLTLLRRTRRRRAVAVLVGALLMVGSALVASTAHAQEPAPALQSDADRGGVPAPVTVPVPETGPLDPSQVTWGAYLGGFGSLSQGAIGGQFGLRLRANSRWTFGVDGEWNPWLAFNGPTPIRKGVVNLYGTAILRFPLAYEAFNLATTAGLGVSYLLDDLYGAASGSMGPYIALSPLGLEWKFSSSFLLIFNPLGFALPVPKITGVPLWFPQYRVTIGIAWMAG